jgi:putative ABC transport system permease protein
MVDFTPLLCTHPQYTTMFLHFLKTAARNIRRHTGFAFINIAGLTIGLTACLLIGLFVRDEKQYDKFVHGAESIYRVYQQSEADETNIIATAPPAFATALKHNYPEVQQSLRVMSLNSKQLFEANNKKLYEQQGFVADSNFFEVFPLALRHGSHTKALEDPDQVVISAAISEKFFGNDDPVGREIILFKETFSVSAVLEKGQKFHLPVNYIVSASAIGLAEDRMQSWQWYPFHTYVKLKPGSDAAALEAKFQTFSKPFLKGDGPANIPLFQPLLQIHLYASDFKYDAATRGNISYVKALTIIAVFILLIACFNFVNLATSKSLQRAKEVGVRKTIGASRKQLVAQFIGETMVYAFASMLLAIVATYFLLPLLNNFTEKHIAFDVFTNIFLVSSMIALALVVGLVSGIYPALILSGFKPIKVLKSSVTADTATGKTPWVRHGLVVVQFSLSVLMIISAIVVISQVNYMHNKDLGFKKEQVLFFPMRGEQMTKNYENFKNTLKQYPAVAAVSVGYGFPGDNFGDGMMIVKEKTGQEPIKATQVMVDEDYIKTLGLSLVAGRDFSNELKTDVQHYIINETAVKDFGLGTPQEAIGKTLSWPTWRKADSLKTGQVIGVVKDFHYKSLHERVEPAVLHIYPAAYSKVAVKLQAGAIETAIADIKAIWNTFSPDYPFEYSFLDESFATMYKAENKLKTLLSWFTAITIFVACLGLFGLAAYAAQRRRKELGIRKVLGASVHGLVVLLSKDFLKLVLISLVVASPIAWYFMNKWLENFSYRIHISWWIFVAAGIFAILLALITVSFQAVKAALTNPVKNLRTE